MNRVNTQSLVIRRFHPGKGKTLREMEMEEARRIKVRKERLQAKLEEVKNQAETRKRAEEQQKRQQRNKAILARRAAQFDLACAKKEREREEQLRNASKRTAQPDFSQGDRPEKFQKAEGGYVQNTAPVKSKARMRGGPAKRGLANPSIYEKYWELVRQMKAEEEKVEKKVERDDEMEE